MPTYKLRYLPTFERELKEAIDYIKQDLQNPEAAINLLEEIEKAIHRRLFMPAAYKPVRLLYDPQHPYYKIHVKNYVVYYVVIDDAVEIRRLLHSKRNVEIIQ